MRTLVLGARGQLGAELVRVLGGRGHHVTGLGRQELDITRAEAVEQAFRQHRPDWVLNAAAYNQVDVAETEPLAAMQANGLAVRHLGVCCRNTGALLLHYSTDHVFSGLQTRPYTEDDPPAPVSAYGVSKLAGELYAQVYAERGYIVRTAGVFGPAGRNTNRGNFVELMLRLAAEGRAIRVVDDFYAAPTYAPALAERSVSLIERGAAYGVYHIAGGAGISWYEYARRIFTLQEIRADLRPTNAREYPTPARRPRYSVLSNAKMEAAGLAPMPSLDDALVEYFGRR